MAEKTALGVVGQSRHGALARMAENYYISVGGVVCNGPWFGFRLVCVGIEWLICSRWFFGCSVHDV